MNKPREKADSRQESNQIKCHSFVAIGIVTHAA